MTALPISHEAYQLGEGPVWDAARGRLLWVDILGQAVHTARLDGDQLIIEQRLDFDTMVGAVTVGADGSLLVAAAQQLVLVRPDGARQPGPRIVPAGEPRRLNDGKPDPAGRYVVGTLRLAGGSESETLVRLERDGRLTVLDDDLTLSNGLAWSTDGTAMFSVDTIRRTIYVRDYDPATGAVGPRRVFIRFPDDTVGVPDGIAIDAADHLWVAVWGAGAVLRFDPDGRLVDRTAVPAPHTTSVAFAGDDLRQLIITTASNGLTTDQRQRFPDSGRLFTLRVDVPGHPVPAWSGAEFRPQEHAS
jgi:sugar lactone lactonase YvrE